MDLFLDVVKPTSLRKSIQLFIGLNAIRIALYWPVLISAVLFVLLFAASFAVLGVSPFYIAIFLATGLYSVSLGQRLTELTAVERKRFVRLARSRWFFAGITTLASLIVASYSLHWTTIREIALLAFLALVYLIAIPWVIGRDKIDVARILLHVVPDSLQLILPYFLIPSFLSFPWSGNLVGLLYLLVPILILLIVSFELSSREDELRELRARYSDGVLLARRSSKYFQKLLAVKFPEEKLDEIALMIQRKIYFIGIYSSHDTEKFEVVDDLGEHPTGDVLLRCLDLFSLAMLCRRLKNAGPRLLHRFVPMMLTHGSDNTMAELRRRWKEEASGQINEILHGLDSTTIETMDLSLRKAQFVGKSQRVAWLADYPIYELLVEIQDQLGDLISVNPRIDSEMGDQKNGLQRSCAF